MGLDMNLYRKHYIGNEYRKPEERVEVTAHGKNGAAIKNERVHEITESIMYWRKANAIHKWFVDNAQEGNDDCKEYEVSKGQLEDLVKLCKTVIAASRLVDGKIKNGEKMGEKGWEPILEDGKKVEDATSAEILLPTASGFFFGSTDYDEYYIDDLKRTVETLEPLLAEEGDFDFAYRSSW